jgi:phage major head subunit gpT-like protein
MLINAQTLRSAFLGFSAAFQGGLAQAGSQYNRIATVVPSSTKTQEYGWLGDMPGFREWIGDRVVQAMSRHGYSLTNKSYENTIGVNRDDFDDDNLGMYTPMFEMLGNTAALFPDSLTWPLLKNGFATPCYDGQNFFDANHPVLDANGNVVLVANTDGGAGTPWYLVDDSKPLKPLIFQNRKPFTNLIRMDKEDDANVFTKKEYQYGLDGRCQVGFGFWQTSWGSKQTLDSAHYEAARIGLGTMKGDGGRPLNILPKLLVVPPSLEGAAKRLVGNMYNAAGGSNEWFGTAEVLVVPWLS